MIVLENEFVQLVCAPEHGARITSLIDCRSGRDWLVQGVLPAESAAWSAESAVLGGAEAFGWDECVPTVAPCPDPLDAGAPPLRDHGDQWGRPADVATTEDRLIARWTQSRWRLRFERMVRLTGSTVVCDYTLEALGDRPLPVLWSMHALLALEPESRIVVDPARQVRVTHHVGFGLSDANPELVWPGERGRHFDEVASVDARRAAKLVLDAAGLDLVAARTPDGSELRFDWDRSFAPALGIWLDYGGWPPGEERHQVALEPTTSPDDELASAIAAGRARTIEPGTTARWRVELELIAAR